MSLFKDVVAERMYESPHLEQYEAQSDVAREMGATMEHSGDILYNLGDISDDDIEAMIRQEL